MAHRVIVKSSFTEDSLAQEVQKFLDEYEGKVSLISYAMSHTVSGSSYATTAPPVTSSTTGGYTITMPGPPQLNISSTPVYSAMIVVKEDE